MKNKSKQNGVALVIGMILLLVISTISITAMKTSILESKMVAGLKNKEIADAAARSLLNEVERYLYSYYLVSNGTALQAGSEYILKPRSTQSYLFRNSGELTGGFTEISGLSINEKFSGILNEEPQFIIEELSNATSGKDTNGISYAKTDAEMDNAGAASSANGGGTGDESSTEVKLFRVVAKSTDTTGHSIAAFESVMSVQIK